MPPKPYTNTALSVSAPPYPIQHATLLNKRQWSFLAKHYRMTPREVQIAKMVCQGLPNYQIAAVLKIKHGTVKTHMRNIYRKTWVHNKISMFLRFIEDANQSVPNSSTARSEHHLPRR